jgi:septum formation inhibitor MinC
MPVTPVTPVTPVATEALTSLHNLIKQKACALNKPSKQRIQRHVQKLASAAQISFAKQALLQDQNRFLYKINNEAKVRRSTRSVVLGNAKVMSYEDLEEARAKRAAKEKATAGKGKRGRKRKSPAPEPEPEPEPEAKVARMSEVPEPAKAPVAPWRAPVARMY